MSDIEMHDDRDAGLLIARTGGDIAGYIQYFVLEEPQRALVPVHTIVEPAQEGKGIGGSLARELYAIAAREAIVVAPLCPFVVEWAARHPGEAPAVPDTLVEAAKAAVADHPELY
ncbi:GNAT family N-acetyltransferase [Streptomyces sp. NPDC057694]|uniref:GNAT family N-acetyltransferase n=1 Tax=Streptomyces sp. NPDC057694 TaxID=3346216 RepID=UPI00369173B2